MPKRFRVALLVIVVSCVSIAIAIHIAWRTHQEVATVVISIPILIISGLTLIISIPKSARIKIERLSELDLSDLIFYVVPAQTQNETPLTPIEYLLQLHIAVSNLGDRKAVVSSIELGCFKNDIGEVIHLPEAKETIGGMRWLQQSGFINGQSHFQNLTIPPPYILDGDDVMVIRFRTRRGIDWSDRWTIDAIRAYAKPLQNPIVEAFGTVVWRKGGGIVRESFTIPLKVVQQAEYYAAIKDVTHDFTIRPDIAPITISLE